MNPTRRRRPLRILGAAILAAAAISCSPETIQTTVGTGGFRLRSTILQVGDTMTVDAGVWYNDGTFVRDTFARYAVTPGTIAQIGNVSGILSATGEGTATVTATLRGQIGIDTIVQIRP